MTLLIVCILAAVALVAYMVLKPAEKPVDIDFESLDPSVPLVFDPAPVENDGGVGEVNSGQAV